MGNHVSHGYIVTATLSGMHGSTCIYAVLVVLLNAYLRKQLIS